jgi:hypothetical protein
MKDAIDDQNIRTAWDAGIDLVHELEDLHRHSASHHARHSLDRLLKKIRLQLVAEMMDYFGVIDWEERLAALAPATHLSGSESKQLVAGIREVLWPSVDPDRQWTPDTYDEIATILEHAGVGRDAK